MKKIKSNIIYAKVEDEPAAFRQRRFPNPSSNPNRISDQAMYDKEALRWIEQFPYLEYGLNVMVVIIQISGHSESYTQKQGAHL